MDRRQGRPHPIPSGIRCRAAFASRAHGDCGPGYAYGPVEAPSRHPPRWIGIPDRRKTIASGARSADGLRQRTIATGRGKEKRAPEGARFVTLQVACGDQKVVAMPTP